MASYVSVDDPAALTSPQADVRAVAPRRRKVRDRVSLGHLFMIAAGLLAFVLVVSLLQDRSATVEVVVADGEILPGTPITPDLVTVSELPAGADLVDSLATMADIQASRVSAAYRIGPGDPITRTALAPAATPSALRAMSLPIDRVRAVGGDISPGDRVDVIAVVGGIASYIAVDLEVLDTQNADVRSGALSASSLSTYYVTVSIDDRTALELALAMDQGEVTVLRSTGAEPVAANARQLVAPNAVGRTSVEDSDG
ncbi:MAG: RcpC/CpaB family pilus assembly protein [Actinomycetota bacterium]